MDHRDTCKFHSAQIDPRKLLGTKALVEAHGEISRAEFVRNLGAVWFPWIDRAYPERACSGLEQLTQSGEVGVGGISAQTYPKNLRRTLPVA